MSAFISHFPSHSRSHLLLLSDSLPLNSFSQSAHVSFCRAHAISLSPPFRVYWSLPMIQSLAPPFKLSSSSVYFCSQASILIYVSLHLPRSRCDHISLTVSESLSRWNPSAPCPGPLQFSALLLSQPPSLSVPQFVAASFRASISQASLSLSFSQKRSGSISVRFSRPLSLFQCIS